MQQKKTALRVAKNSQGRVVRQKAAPIEEPDNQYVMTKNKFYGKTLDRFTDQQVYFERYLNTVNVRIVRGYLRMAQAVAQDELEHPSSENGLRDPMTPTSAN